MSKIDLEVYYYKEGGQLKGVVMVHVDNLLYAGTDKFQKNIIDQFTKMFIAGSKDTRDFVYVGWHLKQSTSMNA